MKQIFLFDFIMFVQLIRYLYLLRFLTSDEKLTPQNITDSLKAGWLMDKRMVSKNHHHQMQVAPEGLCWICVM